MAAQNTFCDAKEMAENQQIYQELANEIAQQKANLLQKYLDNGNPYGSKFRIFYGGN